MNPRRNLPAWLIVAATVVVLVFAAWSVGSLVRDMHALADAQRVAAQRAVDDAQEMKEAVEAAVEEIRLEVRNPAGDRAETHEAARRAEAALGEVLVRLDRLLELAEAAESSG